MTIKKKSHLNYLLVTTLASRIATRFVDWSLSDLYSNELLVDDDHDGERWQRRRTLTEIMVIQVEDRCGGWMTRNELVGLFICSVGTLYIYIFFQELLSAVVLSMRHLPRLNLIGARPPENFFFFLVVKWWTFDELRIWRGATSIIYTNSDQSLPTHSSMCFYYYVWTWLRMLMIIRVVSCRAL